jgi:hypothetical protein
MISLSAQVRLISLHTSGVLTYSSAFCSTNHSLKYVDAFLYQVPRSCLSPQSGSILSNNGSSLRRYQKIVGGGQGERTAPEPVHKPFELGDSHPIDAGYGRVARGDQVVPAGGGP